MDWRKGLNRLFVIVAIGWMVYVLWYVPVQQWHERFNMASDNWKECLKTALDDKSAVEQCNVEHQKELGQIPRTAWADLSLKSWLYLMGFAVIPPLCVYGLVRALSLVVAWVWHGFT